MISFRPAVRPVGCLQNLNTGLLSKTMVLSSIKLCMLIFTIKPYAPTPQLLTFDRHQGHRVSINFVYNRQFQYFKNRLCHQDETWYNCKVYQMYVTQTGFVRLFSVQLEVIDKTEIRSKPSFFSTRSVCPLPLLKTMVPRLFKLCVIIISQKHYQSMLVTFDLSSRSQDQPRNATIDILRVFFCTISELYVCERNVCLSECVHLQ